MRSSRLVLSLFLTASVLFAPAISSAASGSDIVSPETLVSVSGEKVSFPISDDNSVNQIKTWISTGETPSSAELSCEYKTASCERVKYILTSNNIKVKANASNRNIVDLHYAKASARDCSESRAGCASSANMLRMIGSVRTIVSSR